MRCINVGILSLLRSTAEQNHYPLAVFAKINSITRPKIQPQFIDPGTYTFGR